MPITVPAPNTPIMAETFGAPVANEVNRIGTLLPVVLAEVVAPGNTSLPAGVWTLVAGTSVPFTALANRRYRASFGWNISSSGTGGTFMSAGLALDGSIVREHAFVNSFSNPNYGIAGTGHYWFDKKFASSISAGSHTLSLQGSGSAAGTAISSGSGRWFIVMEDWGIDP